MSTLRAATNILKHDSFTTDMNLRAAANATKTLKATPKVTEAPSVRSRVSGPLLDETDGVVSLRGRKRVKTYVLESRQALTVTEIPAHSAKAADLPTKKRRIN